MSRGTGVVAGKVRSKGTSQEYLLIWMLGMEVGRILTTGAVGQSKASQFNPRGAEGVRGRCLEKKQGLER